MITHKLPKNYPNGDYEECTVAHWDTYPDFKGCLRCETCNEWIRPHKFGEECKGKKEE